MGGFSSGGAKADTAPGDWRFSAMRRLCLLVMLGPALAGCGLFAGMPAEGPLPAQAVPPQSGQLKPGDAVHIAVAGEQELSGIFIVAANGAIHLELLGDVPAAGMTPDALAQALRQRLAAGYLKEPQVVVIRAPAPVSAPVPASDRALLAGSLPPAPASPPPPLQGSLVGHGQTAPQQKTAPQSPPPVLRPSY